jgi:WD40 repeat protein
MDGTVRVWNPAGADPSIVDLEMPSALILAWSPDGTKLAAGCRRMDGWFYDFSLRAPVALDGGFIRWTRSVDWNADGTQLASAGERGLRVWDVSTRSPLWEDRKSFERLNALVWDHKRGRIIAGGGHGFSLWNSKTGTILQTVPLKHGAFKLALSQDGHKLAVAGSNIISTYDAEKLTRIRHWPAHREVIYSIAWHPAGTLLASGGADTSAKIWDTRTGRVLHTLNGHGGPVRHVTWSPDGTRLCTGGSDATVRLWDTGTGLEICVFDKPDSIMQYIQGLAWSPDGSRIGISDGEGNLVILDATPGWEAASGRPVNALPARDLTSRQETIRSLRVYCDTFEAVSENDSDALRRLAWVRATSPYPEVRDGPKALRFAQAANREIGGNNAGILSILAAAHAECGDFEQAIATQKQAISLISSDLRRSAFAAQLRLYESRRPCRDDSW